MLVLPNVHHYICSLPRYTQVVQDVSVRLPERAAGTEQAMYAPVAAAFSRALPEGRNVTFCPGCVGRTAAFVDVPADHVLACIR